jgi:hypothetical protein
MYANWHTQQANGWAGLLCMPIGIHNIIDMHNNKHANGLLCMRIGIQNNPLACTTTHRVAHCVCHLAYTKTHWLGCCVCQLAYIETHWHAGYCVCQLAYTTTHWHVVYANWDT